MNSDQNIFGARLKLARKMAGMSLQDLSDALVNKVTKQALSKYEQGLMNPTSEVLMTIAKTLNLKPDYFLKPTNVELGEVLFRKKASLTKRDEDIIVEKVRDYVERYQELEEILNVTSEFINPMVDFEIKIKSDVEDAAVKVRELWCLGNNPIPNLVEMLELKGIKVLLIDEVDAIDGLAAITSNGTPVIVVNRRDKSLERVRFTIVHELAHLILDLSVVGDNNKQIEEWCHYFSTCFLLPSNMLLQMIGGGKRSYIAIKELINIKEYYGISIRAIVHRLKQLEVITDSYYQRWVIYMSKTYGSKDEPGQYKGEENARGFTQLISRALAEGIISLSKAATLCNTSIDSLRKDFASVS